MTIVDPREFRRTVGLFATGVTVITAQAGGDVHGMTANSITSVSLDPLLMLVCVDRRANMYTIITEAGRFAINILGEHQEAVSRHFAGRPGDQPIAFAQLDGVPILYGTLATIACTTDQVLDGGDHIIVIGRVDAISQAAQVRPPLLYFGGRYHHLAGDVTDAGADAEGDFFYQNVIPFE